MEENLVGASFKRFSIKYFAKLDQIITLDLTYSSHSNGNIITYIFYNFR